MILLLTLIGVLLNPAAILVVGPGLLLTSYAVRRG